MAEKGYTYANSEPPRNRESSFPSSEPTGYDREVMPRFIAGVLTPLRLDALQQREQG